MTHEPPTTEPTCGNCGRLYHQCLCDAGEPFAPLAPMPPAQATEQLRSPMIRLAAQQIDKAVDHIIGQHQFTDNDKNELFEMLVERFIYRQNFEPLIAEPLTT